MRIQVGSLNAIDISRIHSLILFNNHNISYVSLRWRFFILIVFLQILHNHPLWLSWVVWIQISDYLERSHEHLLILGYSWKLFYYWDVVDVDLRRELISHAVHELVGSHRLSIAYILVDIKTESVVNLWSQLDYFLLQIWLFSGAKFFLLEEEERLFKSRNYPEVSSNDLSRLLMEIVMGESKIL